MLLTAICPAQVGCYVTVPIYGQPFGVSAMEVVGLLSFDTAGKDIDTVPYADVSFVENVCGELSMKVTPHSATSRPGLASRSATSGLDSLEIASYLSGR